MNKSWKAIRAWQLGSTPSWRKPKSTWTGEFNHPMSETLRSAATDTLKKEHRKEIDPLSGNLSPVQAEADRRADEAAEQNSQLQD